jgi:hypothetical protein
MHTCNTYEFTHPNPPTAHFAEPTKQAQLTSNKERIKAWSHMDGNNSRFMLDNMKIGSPNSIPCVT